MLIAGNQVLSTLLRTVDLLIQKEIPLSQNDLDLDVPLLGPDESEHLPDADLRSFDLVDIH